MATTIGLIGAGQIGSQLARFTVGHGYDVLISNSRGPETLSGLVRELGLRTCAASDACAPCAATAPLYRSNQQVPLTLNRSRWRLGCERRY